MNKVIAFAKDAAYGVPMMLASLALAYVVVKVLASVADKAAPGKGEVVRALYSAR